MKYLSYGERAFLRGHLNRVRHVTLDPDGPGVVRIHLIPCTKPDRDTPFVAILNGQDILPLNLSWAILLTNLIEALQPHAGTELKDSDWSAINAQAVAATRKIYRKTEPLQIESDLQMMLDTLIAVARGKEPPLHIQPISLAQYAPRMAAPHRMDLMISTMVKDNAWHCNQKCLHGEPTLRQDLVKLVQAAQWFVTRLNTNGRMLTSALCKDLRAASLDAVQITFYSADEAVHNELVGVDGYTDTVNGIKNALAAGLNVSLNTPLCSLNKDYRATVEFAYDLGIRYLTCSGLIPAGNAEAAASKSVRLTPEELTEVLRPAMDFALSHGMEVNFTSPGWLDEDTLTGLGFTQIPSCGACLSNMAVAPDGTVLPCQSWLTGHGLGHILRTPWNRIWRSPECGTIRVESARMKRLCQLGDTPMQEGF